PLLVSLAFLKNAAVDHHRQAVRSELFPPLALDHYETERPLAIIFDAEIIESEGVGTVLAGRSWFTILADDLPKLFLAAISKRDNQAAFPVDDGPSQSDTVFAGFAFLPILGTRDSCDHRQRLFHDGAQD